MGKNEPRLIDLFCGEGGAAYGYHIAGFEVYGVDINPQPDYPFWFHQGDAIHAMDMLSRGHSVKFTNGSTGVERDMYLGDFHAGHASPPCQAHSTITPDKSKHVDLIPDVRDRLKQWSQPWVIENVEGARKALIDPVKLCGSSFGLQVRRHRYFETSLELKVPECDHRAQGSPIGVYGGLRKRHWERPNGTSRGRKATSLEQGREVMGMPWASWEWLTQAIPPAYSQFIGEQLLRAARSINEGETNHE